MVWWPQGQGTVRETKQNEKHCALVENHVMRRVNSAGLSDFDSMEANL